MSDPVKLDALRKALEPRLIAPEFLPLYEAAAAYLALESDAIVIRRDSEGGWPIAKGLQDVLEDMYCTRLQKLGIHERGRCVALASVAVELFTDRLDALAESSKGAL